MPIRPIRRCRIPEFGPPLLVRVSSLCRDPITFAMSVGGTAGGRPSDLHVRFAGCRSPRYRALASLPGVSVTGSAPHCRWPVVGGTKWRRPGFRDGPAHRSPVGASWQSSGTARFKRRRSRCCRVNERRGERITRGGGDRALARVGRHGSGRLADHLGRRDGRPLEIVDHVGDLGRGVLAHDDVQAQCRWAAVGDPGS